MFDIFTTPVLNLVGGPGTGKSTTMAGTFFELKSRGITAEMAPEWFKGKVWEGTAEKLVTDQLYITAKQNHELHRLMNTGVEVVITDCPLLLGIVYGENETSIFKKLVVDYFDRYNNTVVFLNRVKSYDPNGRMQTHEQAQGIDVKVKDIMNFLGIPFLEVDACPEAPKVLADLMETQL
jgi:GTPase Era involved in 16S rRNA processing